MSDDCGKALEELRAAAADAQIHLQRSAKGRTPVHRKGSLWYEWEQDLTDVHVFLCLPEGVRARDLKVDIAPNRLCVALKGQPPLLDGELFSTVDASESLWLLEDGELHVQLGKMRKAEVWHAALKGHNSLNPLAVEEVQKKLMLERFGEEHPGFDFSNATFSGSAPNPRDFMGGVKYQ